MKYKYLIYKIYSWTAKKRGDTPIANTILTLAIVHLFQAFVLYLFIDRIITPLGWFNHINKAYAFIGLIAYFMSFYFLVYNKKRWKSYIEEFGNESEHQRNRGNRLVISYLIGSILLFFISLPILFFLGKRLHG